MLAHLNLNSVDSSFYRLWFNFFYEGHSYKNLGLYQNDDSYFIVSVLLIRT